jgi:xanthine/uracil permease
MAQARADFFRMVRWIIAVGVILVIAAIVLLVHQGLARPSVIIGTIAGVFLSILLGCGLFAAAFFSDKSGHDEHASRATEHDPDKRS